MDTPNKTEVDQTDIVIIGGGGSGLAATVSAAKKILIDKKGKVKGVLAATKDRAFEILAKSINNNYLQYIYWWYVHHRKEGLMPGYYTILS